MGRWIADAESAGCPLQAPTEERAMREPTIRTEMFGRDRYVTVTFELNEKTSDGVAMKLQNFRRLDPSQEGKGLPGGGRGEEEVWAIFADDPERLLSAAAAIKATVAALEDSPDQEPEDGEEAEEGKVLTRLHRTRERDRRIVERRKANDGVDAPRRHRRAKVVVLTAT